MKAFYWTGLFVSQRSLELWRAAGLSWTSNEGRAAACVMTGLVRGPGCIICPVSLPALHHTARTNNNTHSKE